MPKYKALQNFNSETLGEIKEGQVKEITVGQATAINEHTQDHYGFEVLERVETGKK